VAITIDWPTKVISVPQADLVLVSGSLYELDTDTFRLALKSLEDDQEGMTFPDTHRHNTIVELGGVSYARTVEIINGYTVTFEDGAYRVRLAGSNNNIADVTNINQVSIASNNSAGLIQQNELLQIKYLIESSRRHPAYGEVIYWNPATGDDGFDGATPTRAKKTYASCEGLIGDDGAIVFLISSAPGDLVVDERVTVTKDRVSIHGPGKSLILKPSTGTDPVVTIDAANCSIGGLQVQSAAGGSVTGVRVNGDFAQLSDLYVHGVSGTGVYVNGGSHHEILGCDITSCGGDGIHLFNVDRSRISQSASGASNRIQRNVGSGIVIESTSPTVRSTDNLIEYTMTHHNGPVEIHNMVNSSMTIIRRSVYLSPWADGAAILDEGSATHNEWAEMGVAEAGQMADYVWDEALDGTYTGRELMRLLASAMAGKVSGAAGTEIRIRDIDDTKDRIVATVDADGNRTAVARDAS
jgi:hypothetical protein